MDPSRPATGHGKAPPACGMLQAALLSRRRSSSQPGQLAKQGKGERSPSARPPFPLEMEAGLLFVTVRASKTFGDGKEQLVARKSWIGAWPNAFVVLICPVFAPKGFPSCALQHTRSIQPTSLSVLHLGPTRVASAWFVISRSNSCLILTLLKGYSSQVRGSLRNKHNGADRPFTAIHPSSPSLARRWCLGPS